MHPLYPIPPHWPHFATVQDEGLLGVGAAVERVDVASVVGCCCAGVEVVLGLGVELGLGLGLEPPPLSLPEQVKTEGPGTV